MWRRCSATARGVRRLLPPAFRRYPQADQDVALRLSAPEAVRAVLVRIQHGDHGTPDSDLFVQRRLVQEGHERVAARSFKTRQLLARHRPVLGVAVGQRYVDERRRFESTAITHRRRHMLPRSIEYRN